MSPKKPFPSQRVLGKLLAAAKPAADGIFVHNRNPRNLEMMKIAYKPDGYHLEKPDKSYWHRLVLEKLGHRGVMAQVLHYRNGIVLKASTTEWGLQKQLYRPYDTSAYINLGKVFAERCLQAGVIEMFCDLEGPAGGKIEHFLKEVEKGGVILSEAQRYKKAHPCDAHRMEKPWDIHVD